MRYSIIIALLFCLSSAQAQTFNVGIISDFETSDNLETVIDLMIEEIDKTTGSLRKVKRQRTIYGIASIDSVPSQYRQLEGEVDLVIALGSVSAKGISVLDTLTTPTIAMGIIDPTLQNIPYQNGRSGKKNFTYIWQTQNLEVELQAFNKVHDFKNLAVFVDEKAASTMNREVGAKIIDSLSTTFETSIKVIPIGDDPTQAMSQLPSETDAAYFTVLLSQSETQLQTLIDQLNERQIPTFTGNARLLELGVLGSMTNENGLQQVLRKLSIMVDEILSGEDLATLLVRLDTKESLYVNLTTARKIQLPIPFEVLFTATLIGDDEGNVPTYSFEEIAEKSLTANLNIKISYQDIARTELDIRSIKANLLPSLELGMAASQINEERANAIFNSPERSVTGNLTLTQLIYSKQAIAGVKISQYLKKAQEYNTQAEILNVLLDTYTAYLNVLSAKTNVLIQQENLTNTKKNKELASIRVNIGASNNADLYRWESEVALANQSVIEAQTGLLAAKFQLNTLLANTLEEEFDIADVSLQDEWFEKMNRGLLDDVIKTPQSLKKASDFLVAESQRINPNKKALIENINATNRQLVQNKRILYVPAVALQAQTSQILARGGAGSSLEPSQATMALGIPSELQDNSWFVGVSLSFPIFSGFSRKVAIQQSKVSLEQLGNANTSLDQNLELGIRAGVLNLLSSSTNIRFSNEASESAQQNFELVQENYKQGTVIITQLIDAQQVALQARLAAGLSVYQYIQSYLQLEFNVGVFTMLLPEEQQQDFNNRLQEYLTDQN